MPLCFRFPPQVARWLTFVGPMPYFDTSALCYHLRFAVWTSAAKLWRRFWFVAIDYCKSHLVLCHNVIYWRITPEYIGPPMDFQINCMIPSRRLRRNNCEASGELSADCLCSFGSQDWLIYRHVKLGSRRNTKDHAFAGRGKAYTKVIHRTIRSARLWVVIAISICPIRDCCPNIYH